MSKWVYLSYELSDGLSTYGNGQPFHKEITRSIAQGDSSNNSTLHFPAHTGTHIDFPYHFCPGSNTGSRYDAADMIFNHIQYLEIHRSWDNRLLIEPSDLVLQPDNTTDLLIIKTGYCHYRSESKYWEYNPGFAPECAAFLKQLFPSLRAVAFDSISLSSWQHRDMGREAHRAFLCEHDILLVEDVDLQAITSRTWFNKVVISPLRFENADGTPVTIFAEITET